MAEMDEMLEDRFLPALNVLLDQIQAEHPRVRAQVFSQPYGQATDTPGRVIGLSCRLPNAEDDQPDEVVLELVFHGKDQRTRTVEANVIWGHPGQVEADLFPVAVRMDDRSLQHLEEALPILAEALLKALDEAGPPRRQSWNAQRDPSRHSDSHNSLTKNLLQRLPLGQFVDQLIKLTNHPHQWILDLFHPDAADHPLDQRTIRIHPRRSCEERLKVRLPLDFLA